MNSAADLLTRAAALAPATLDEDARTVEAVFSTGAPVPRRDAAGPFLEMLSLDPGHVDTSRLIGASVLDSHRQDSLGRVLGVVADAHVNGREGRATIRFSARPDVEPYWQDVKAGIIRGVSVGYRVEQWREGRDAAGRRTRTAVRWAPAELSLVAVPADPAARVRSETVSEENTAVEIADRAEINRQIRDLATAAGLGRDLADDLIDRGASVEAARAEMFDALVSRAGPAIRHQRVEAGASGDDPAVLVTRMSEALACRITGAAPSESARPFACASLRDMARDLLAARGERVLGQEDLLRRALHTTSDFPNLLTSTGNRVLQASYQAAQSPLRAIARQTTLADFRARTSLRLGGIGALWPLNEHGEIKRVTRAEAAETYKLSTYAAMFGLTREAVVNDDLNAFGDWAATAGRAAAETEAGALAALLTANGGNGVAMSDGKALFHADHGNKAGTAAALAVAPLSAARAAMRAQKDLDGTTPINVAPRYLLVPPGLETTAEQLMATLAPATLGEVNPFAGKLVNLVEPRLSGTAWRLFADPAVMPVLEYAYLAGAPGPQIASREGWDILGVEFRVHLDFGCGALDWRGAYLNAGA